MITAAATHNVVLFFTIGGPTSLATAKARELVKVGAA